MNSWDSYPTYATLFMGHRGMMQKGVGKVNIEENVVCTSSSVKWRDCINDLKGLYTTVYRSRASREQED